MPWPKPRATGILIGLMAFGLGQGVASAAGRCEALPDSKIALQMYSMNGALRDPVPAGARGGGRGATSVSTIETVLTGLHAIGYKNAELAGLFGQPVDVVRPLLDKHQIKVIGNHGQFTTDLSAWATTLADAQALGQGPMIGSAGYGPPGLAGGLANVLATAANLNKLGEAAAARGLQLYMHNHAAEITTRYEYDVDKDGKPESASALEIVATNTDPRYVHFEIDVHWARMAFDNREEELLAFLKRLSGRIVALHVKDTTADGKITDLGAGITDWPKVYAAAGPGVRYYIWEYDGAPEPMKNAETAYRFMRCDK